MTEPIEFKLTKASTVEADAELWTRTTVAGIAAGDSPTTPAEFDVVARRLHYIPASELSNILGLEATLTTEDVLNIMRGTKQAADRTLPEATAEEVDLFCRSRGYMKTLERVCGSMWMRDIRDELKLPHDAPIEIILDTLRRIIAEREIAKRDEWSGEICSAVLQIRRPEETTSTAILRLVSEQSHTCLIDGVTYRGNEEMIGKMEEMLQTCRHYIANKFDLKRQLAEAKDDNVILFSANGALGEEAGELRNQLNEANKSIEEWRLSSISRLEHMQELQIELTQLRAELQMVSRHLASGRIPEKWQKAIETVLDGIDDMSPGTRSISNALCPIPDTWGELAASDIVRASRTKDIRDIDSAASACIRWLADELEKPEAKR